MYWPKRLFVTSQVWNLSELRAKQYAARSRKGVVGSTGRMIPINPSRMHIIPQAMRRLRFRGFKSSGSRDLNYTQIHTENDV
jgi:hypothetical protein